MSRLLLAVGLLCASCGNDDGGRGRLCSPPEGTIPALRLEEVASGLVDPVAAVSPPGELRMFILEQQGRIRVIDEGVLDPEPFADLTDHVQCCGEQGLLGLAFHPDFAGNGRYF